MTLLDTELFLSESHFPTYDQKQNEFLGNPQAVKLVIFMTDKLADAILLWEKNTIP